MSQRGHVHSFLVDAGKHVRQGKAYVALTLVTKYRCKAIHPLSHLPGVRVQLSGGCMNDVTNHTDGGIPYMTCVTFAIAQRSQNGVVRARCGESGGIPCHRPVLGLGCFFEDVPSVGGLRSPKTVR